MVVGLWLHSRSVKKHHPRCREKPVGLQLFSRPFSLQTLRSCFTLAD